ncbi:MAG: hypothetical protein ACOX5A_08985 [Aminivibrio sp.]|jgi:hypothetical protein
MKKFASALLLTILVMVFPLICGADSGSKLLELSGYLIGIEKTPPLIKLATGSGEKMFRWIPGETGFFGYEGDKIEAGAFTSKFKHLSITLVLENKTVINVFATRF